ncbi:hypothetical protein PsorP6_008600 [Peronosclerospora sorghi]|uniref:Uncharacterized protein n=1 Tax=Peronosclerospora sorghi TaxID=230839 RepID=A0ACC0WA74_9STRA|nr:hypothetical protein PsorP6_008600 [Peronosclerospora sorghi]
METESVDFVTMISNNFDKGVINLYGAFVSDGEQANRHKYTIKTFHEYVAKSQILIPDTGLTISELEKRFFTTLIHGDLMGPMRVNAKDGGRYVLVLANNWSRYINVYLLKFNSEAFERFKEYMAFMEAHLSCRKKSFARTMVVNSATRSLRNFVLYM